MVFAFAASSFDLSRTVSNWSRPALAVVVLLAMGSAAAIAADAQVVNLTASTTGSGYQEVRVVVEVEGKLKVNSDGKEVQHVPLKATANLQYVERLLSATNPGGPCTVVRHYQQAEAKIRLRETDLTNSLRDERRLIAREVRDGQPVHYSPLGPLMRDELELIEAPASGISLSTLLPGHEVKVGGEWKLDDKVAGPLFNLEAVNQQDITCKLESVKDDVAVASLEGTVAGAMGGVSSDLELKGKLNFDLKKRAVTWLTLAINEKRAIGHAQPGFEVTTRLRMIAAPCDAAPELNDEALATLKTAADGGQTLIEFTAAKPGFQLIHDRRWLVMVDRHDATILRLVDRGDLVAQCNISPLPALPEGQALDLAGFQNDVKQALGKNFGEVVEAAQEAGDDGIAVQRVTVSGSAGELPIQWTYYHLFDDKGHRASLVFTIEGSLVERFAQIDRELISGFHFLPDKLPTPAQADSADSATRPTDAKAAR
jgi:hypothetical protein